MINYIKDYNNSLKYDSFNSDAYFYKGKARYDIGDIKGAIKDYTSAIYNYPDFGQAYYERSIAHSDLGDKKSTEADYRKYL